MGGNGLILHVGGGGGELERHLRDAKVLSVPCLGEVITVEDLAVTAVNLNGSAAVDVTGHVVFLSAERHAWAVSEDGSLGELLSLEQLGEGSAAAILGVDL